MCCRQVRMVGGMLPDDISRASQAKKTGNVSMKFSTAVFAAAMPFLLVAVATAD